MNLSLLSAFFSPEDIEWRIGTMTRDKKKALALAYLTNRAVMQRLDDVCGPAGWRNEFREGPGGGVICGISVFCELPDGTWEWVTKWDGADNTQVEAVKGGLSDAMKRAGYQWGIGRYLYTFPSQWVRLDERQRFAESPRVPSEFVPAPASGGPRAGALTPAQADLARALKAAGVRGHRAADLLGAHGYERISEVPDGTARQMEAALTPAGA